MRSGPRCSIGTGMAAMNSPERTVPDLLSKLPDLSAGVLAGGAGQRMDGVDKGLQLFRGLPLVQHVLAAVAPQVSECLISANRNLDRYQALGLRVVCDAEGQGPLAGLAALLAAASHDWLLCLPCDAPLLPPDLAEQLFAAVATAGADAAFLHDGVGAHPTFCLVRTRLAASAQAAAASKMGLHEWLRQQGAVAVLGAAPINLNTVAELKALEQAA